MKSEILDTGDQVPPQIRAQVALMLEDCLSQNVDLHRLSSGVVIRNGHGGGLLGPLN